MPLVQHGVLVLITQQFMAESDRDCAGLYQTLGSERDIDLDVILPAIRYVATSIVISEVSCG